MSASDRPDEQISPSLNLKQAAAALRVHYMTVYRYVRQGRLDAVRVGTEWRVPLRVLDSFLSGETDGRVHDASARADAAWDRRLESCLLAGDETAAWRVVETALAAGRSPTYCYVDVLGAALSSIGERWAKGDLDVADQYLASAVATRLVSRLGARFRRPGRSRGTVVFGAPPGELHSLPIAIVSDLVRLKGYDVLELGGNAPPEAFVSSALRTPRLLAIGIGVTQPEWLGSAQLVVNAVRAVDRDVPVILGGLAVTEFDGVAMTGITAVAANGREAVAIVEAIAEVRAVRRVV